tara:strand:- start:1146 stop:1478 length:333 start_codon:yes stop_codon:yes gene_type:complete
MSTIWTSDGTHCSRDGILQPQSFEILAVSTTIPEAMRDPTNHEALNMEVMNGRSFGYESSPNIDEPDTRQKTIPNPRIMRATIYMPTAKLSVNMPFQQRDATDHVEKTLG